MNDILCRQLAIDYCCAPEEVLDQKNHFAEHRFLEGRRRFLERTECYLKIAVINGKLLFTGRADILAWCREAYETEGSAWFFEVKNLRKLNDRIYRDGYQIQNAHPFFISESITEADTSGYTICRYHDDDIEQFRGDDRFHNAYAFCKEAPDVIGVSAMRDGVIVGMAGASCDSPTMWQIGIDVDPESRQNGIGKMLVTLLKNDILRKGILPYYGTGMSHIASQKVALGSGFELAWAELVTSKII